MTRGSPREHGIARYVRAHGPVPTFRWDYGRRQFTGVRGFTLKRYGRPEGAWIHAKERFWEWQGKSRDPLILFVTRMDHDSEKTLVLMALPTFTKLFGRFVFEQPEKYLMSEKFMDKE